MYNSKIIGLGKYVPDNVVTNDDLSKFMDTSDEWIQERTGIQERRYVTDDLQTSDIAFIAAKTNFSPFENRKFFVHNIFFRNWAFVVKWVFILSM